MMSFDMNIIDIININDFGYHCIINGINKREAIHL